MVHEAATRLAVANGHMQGLQRELRPHVVSGGIADDTPLVTQGILDSLASLKLVSFLEDHYGISVAAHEVDVEYLNTISDIASLVLSKQAR